MEGVLEITKCPWHFPKNMTYPGFDSKPCQCAKFYLDVSGVPGIL